jgi:hypothetical protein
LSAIATYAMAHRWAGWTRLALGFLLAWSAAVRADDTLPDKSAFTLLDPTPDGQLRPFSTDRPPKANSPYTVDAGHFQYETDLAVFSRDNEGGTLTRSWTVFDPTLKLGLTNTVDAELQLTPYESVVSSAAGTRTRLSGGGDTIARVKWNVLGDDGGDVSVALLPYVKLPTARSGLGNGRTEGGLILPVGLTAPLGFMLVVMPQVDVLKNESNDGVHGAFDFLVNASHALGPRWTAYTELYGARPFASGSRTVITFDNALTFAATPVLQFDFGANSSLNGVGPRIQYYAGLSQRF